MNYFVVSTISKVSLLNSFNLFIKLGFGRGSKELGIPTANFNEKVVDELPKDLETGIYFGWTNLEGEAIVRKAVVSIGYNPFYENKTKSVVRN